MKRVRTITFEKIFLPAFIEALIEIYEKGADYIDTTGTGATAVYKYPNSVVNIEKSIKITPESGMGLILTRCKITAKLSPALGRTALMGVEVTGTLLQPKKAGEAPLSTFRV